MTCTVELLGKTVGICRLVIGQVCALKRKLPMAVLLLIIKRAIEEGIIVSNRVFLIAVVIKIPIHCPIERFQEIHIKRKIGSLGKK